MKFSLPILVVGFGSIGKRHVNNLLTLTQSPIIIHTKRTNIKKNDFKNHKNNLSRIKILSNLEECFKHQPSVGIICNESSLHIEYAIKLAKKNMDLFIEKPLSNSKKNISSLKKIMSKSSRISMVGCNFRFYPPIIKIKNLIENKKIGRIISVQSENSSYLPDWHPNEDYSKGYAAKKNLGGGVTLTQIHELDYLSWIFGLPKIKKSIVGKFSDLNVQSDDLSVSLFEFKNKIIIETHLDYFSKPYYKRLKIRGTLGTIFWNSIENNVRIFNFNSNKWKNIPITNNYKLTNDPNPMYIDEMKYFLNCVKKRSKPMNSVDESRKILNVVLK